MAVASSKEVKTRPQVDPADEPSAEWGWHGNFPKLVQVLGWLVVGLLLIMLIGNHQGRTEDLWLLTLAAVFGGALLLDLRKRRTAWRR